MELRAGVIVREEDDGVLLYNGSNGGLIRIALDVFDQVFVQGTASGSQYPQLRECLNENGFLVGGPSHPPREKTAPERAEELRGFFGLRSQRSPLNVLWAVTPVCNLRCLYCFPDASSHAMEFQAEPLSTLQAIADQIIEGKVLKVTLSGGECLLLEGVWKIAERLRQAGCTVAMLTNGVCVTEEVAERGEALGLIFGVSLDGPNDQVSAVTRGPGAFQGATRAISLLVDHGLPVAVLVTVTRHNFFHIPQLVSLVAGLGADTITLQDLRPFGTRDIYDQTRLTREQERQLEPLVTRLRLDYPCISFETSELFLYSKRKTNGLVMQCPAGDNFAYIDFYGDVYPCTSLPSFKLGSLVQGDSLVDLWQHSERIEALRKLKSLSLAQVSACAGCVDEPLCDGGCRGDALFYSGDLYGRPSRCPIELGLR